MILRNLKETYIKRSLFKKSHCEFIWNHWFARNFRCWLEIIIGSGKTGKENNSSININIYETMLASQNKSLLKQNAEHDSDNLTNLEIKYGCGHQY